MTRTKSILAQIQEHLGLPLIPLSPQTAVAPAIASAIASADPAPTVPLAASAALPADHPAIPTQSQDEDEIPPSTAT